MSQATYPCNSGCYKIKWRSETTKPQPPVPSEILTVSELNRQARQCLEQRFALLWVGGEVSNLTRAASGHLYFSLKDSAAQIRCAMFRSRAQLVPWKLENGQQVEVQALVTLYEARGEFQLNVEALRRAGIGRLYELFLRLRDKLSAEGLFADERKRALPRYPRRIAIITSPQAAALRDVLAAFRRRAPHVELILYPTLVQGAEAPAAIVAALETAHARNECDVLLIVRGGGSIEDLWAFNDEAVARALAVSPASTISGVGHETDTTIADYVADQRAATPTAAAELASAGWFDAAKEIDSLDWALRQSLRGLLETRMQALDRLALRLVHPAKRLQTDRQRLELLARRLQAAMQRRVADRQRLDQAVRRLPAALQQLVARQRDRLARCQGALTALSPTATLERGYSIVRTPEGRIVRNAAELTPGDTLHIHLARGNAVAQVESTDKT